MFASFNSKLSTSDFSIIQYLIRNQTFTKLISTQKVSQNYVKLIDYDRYHAKVQHMLFYLTQF